MSWRSHAAVVSQPQLISCFSRWLWHGMSNRTLPPSAFCVVISLVGLHGKNQEREIQHFCERCDSIQTTSNSAGRCVRLTAAHRFACVYSIQNHLKSSLALIYYHVWCVVERARAGGQSLYFAHFCMIITNSHSTPFGNAATLSCALLARVPCATHIVRIT